MKSKLVYITHGLNIGGAEMIVATLASALKNRYEISILALDQDGPLRKQLEEEQIIVKIMQRRAGWHLSNFKKAFSLLKNSQADLIHAHQYTPYMFAVFYKIVCQPKVRLVFTEHGRHYPDIISRKRQLMNQLFLKFTNQITAVCEFAKRALINNEKMSTEISVIYNGITASTESSAINLRTEFNISTDLLIIGYVGSLRPVKNPELLLQAFSQVQKTNSNCCLIYLGDGNLRWQLEKLALELGLTDKVFFAGNRLPAAEYIGQFDIFVQPSLSEAHSLALLEAFSKKRAVIATNVGGASESINHLENGLLVASNDAAALATSINLLLNDPSLRFKLGFAAEDTFKKRFTSEMMIANYLKIYEKLLN